MYICVCILIKTFHTKHMSPEGARKHPKPPEAARSHRKPLETVQSCPKSFTRICFLSSGDVFILRCTRIKSSNEWHANTQLNFYSFLLNNEKRKICYCNKLHIKNINVLIGNFIYTYMDFRFR